MRGLLARRVAPRPRAQFRGRRVPALRRPLRQVHQDARRARRQGRLDVVLLDDDGGWVDVRHAPSRARTPPAKYLACGEPLRPSPASCNPWRL